MSTLPSRPSLKQLKKQAKELHSAHAAGDLQAADRIRTHLPRLTSVPEADLAEAEVSLQEAQHVIAQEYDLKNWDVLRAVVTPDFEVLEFLDDRGVQELLRDIDWWDVFIGLRDSDKSVRERFLSNVTSEMREQIEEEISLPREVSAEEIKEARQRIMLRLAQCEAEGKLTWPSKSRFSEGLNQRTSPEYSPRLLELAGRPLEQLNFDELVELWMEAARQINAVGPLSLEKFCDQIASPLLREGFVLVIDGTEPPLMIDILETRIQMVLYPREDTRRRMTIEAVMSIRYLDYQNIVAHKVGTYYLTGTEPKRNTDYSDTSLQDLQTSIPHMKLENRFPKVP